MRESEVRVSRPLWVRRSNTQTLCRSLGQPSRALIGEDDERQCTTSSAPFDWGHPHMPWLRQTGRPNSGPMPPPPPPPPPCGCATNTALRALSRGHVTDLLRQDRKSLQSRCLAEARLPVKLLQDLGQGWFKCYFTSTETIRLIRDGEPRTATSTPTQHLPGLFSPLPSLCLSLRPPPPPPQPLPTPELSDTLRPQNPYSLLGTEEGDREMWAGSLA